MKVYTSHEVPDYSEFKALDNIATASLKFMMLYHKYRTMWQLRSLESEIDNDGGMIIVSDKGQIQMKGFRSQELVDKISEILRADLD